MAAAGLIVLLAAGGLINLGELKRTHFHNPGLGYPIQNSTPRLVVESLTARGIRHVFCADNDFQWNLNFAGRGQVMARSFPLVDRYPPIGEEVNRAARAGEPVAVVIPHPTGPLKSPLVAALRAAPCAAIEEINDNDALIFYGAPGEAIFKFFPGPGPPDSAE